MPVTDPTPGTFPVLRSLLAPEALARVLGTAYGLSDVRCRLIKATIRDVYHVSTRAASYVVIVYRHANRSVAEIEAELDVLDYLLHRGVSVAPAVPRPTGERILALAAPEGMRHAVLFRYALGTLLGRAPDPGLARRFGHAIAQVHAITENWSEAAAASLSRSPIDAAMLVDRPLALIEPVLAHRPADVEYLHQAAELLHRKLGALPREAPAYGLVHGDAIPTNVLVAPDRRLTLLDFDFFGPGWRAYDVAAYVRDATMSGAPDARAAHFVAGYEEVRRLADWESAAIPLFSAARGFSRLGHWRRRVDEWGSQTLTEDAIDREIASIRDDLARVG